MLIIQRSQIARFSCFGTLAPGPERPYIPSCAEHGAGVGRSSTERLYGAARKGRIGKSTGAVDETATGSANFLVRPALRRVAPASTTIGANADSSSSTEHRPGSHRPRLGSRPRHVHLLRPPGRRSERRDCDRARARLVRWDLVVRSPPRRRSSGPPPALVDLSPTPLSPAVAARARTRACGSARCRVAPRGARAPE